MYEDGVDAADALDLDQVALDARHHGPDVYEGQDGEEDAPHHRQRDAHQRRQQPVAPVLGDGEGGEAGLPHAVEAVGTCRLGDHVLKLDLETRQKKKGSRNIKFWNKKIQRVCWTHCSFFSDASTSPSKGKEKVGGAAEEKEEGKKLQFVEAVLLFELFLWYVTGADWLKSIKCGWEASNKGLHCLRCSSNPVCCPHNTVSRDTKELFHMPCKYKSQTSCWSVEGWKYVNFPLVVKWA